MKRLPEPPDPTASVYVQPAPHGIWSGNNNFGFETKFLPNPGNRERIINLPEWGEPAVWTVSLGIEYSEAAWPVGPSRGFEVVAEIAYGTGGTTETALVDWIQGTTFSVPMNGLSVNAFYSVPDSESPPNRPNDVLLRVLLSRGSVSTGLPPSKFAPLLDDSIFTILTDNTLATPPARIPKFGRRLFLVPLLPTDATQLANGNNYVRFFSAFDVTATAFATGSFRIDSANLVGGFPVPPFSKYVTLENIGGGSGGTAALFNFELQL
ncbi:MAG TPA: hypothetical protein VG937_00095 [Polyangiaceae bacterium]|nr:hypothetical protein [Polyangiaceae bacterium]